MGRAWLNKGRMVLKNGRAALSDECPCAGCGPYTGYYDYAYYVDYSAAASGDGLAPATAFKTLNDVFNSADIYNYRKAGKIVCVFIANMGTITHAFAGTYVSSALNPSDGDLILSPAAAGKTGYHGSRFPTMYNTVFYCWDLYIVGISANAWMFKSRFLHCDIRGVVGSGNPAVPCVLFLRDGCEISDSYINVVAQGGGSGSISSSYGFMVAGSGNVLKNVTITYTVTSYDNVGFVLFYRSGADGAVNQIDCDNVAITAYVYVVDQVLGRSTTVKMFYRFRYSAFKDCACAAGEIVNPYDDCDICLYASTHENNVYYNSPQVSLGSGTCPDIS